MTTIPKITLNDREYAMEFTVILLSGPEMNAAEQSRVVYKDLGAAMATYQDYIAAGKTVKLTNEFFA